MRDEKKIMPPQKRGKFYYREKKKTLKIVSLFIIIA